MCLMTVKNITVAVRAMAFVLICLAAGLSSATAQGVNEEQLKMVIELLDDADRDTRAVGIQFVREEMPGAEATKRFAELLPKLSPERQVELLGALALRADVAARPAALNLLRSDDPSVQTAAIVALGALGNAEDVPALVGCLARGSDEAKQSARVSLAKLKSDGVNGAIITAMQEGDSMDRAELLTVLAGRNAKETLPKVLTYCEDQADSVRIAALGALRVLAGEKEIPQIVEILKKANSRTEKQKAELVLLTVCSISGETAAAIVISGMPESDAASRMALLRALGRVGGKEALETVVASLKDDDAEVANEAARMLSAWPDPAAESHLRELAKSYKIRSRVLAFRGLVRLATPPGDKRANLELLAEVIKLADRPEEKRLAVGSLNRMSGPEALKLAAAAMDYSPITDEAGLAVVMIAKRSKDADKETLRAALEKVKSQAKAQRIRDLAEEVLKSIE
jgi:HEAT repeat protein